MLNMIYELLNQPALAVISSLQEQIIRYIERCVTVMGEATADLVLSVTRL